MSHKALQDFRCTTIMLCQHHFVYHFL